MKPARVLPRLLAPLILFAMNTSRLPAEFEWLDTSLPLEKRADALIAEMTLEEKASQMLDYNKGLPRLGIPEYNWWNEALHGVARNGRATVFPQAIALAATFDVDLAHRVATAISDEARAKFAIAQAMGNRSKYAGITFWTPNINIFRDPRWGRGQETYGEDPWLTSRIGVAFVRGLQGDDPRHLKVAACAKHYAVHSGPEALRHEFDAVVSRRDLYETYLPAFEALVREAHVEAVMGAYNRVYGESASASRFLLTEILRERWGFRGHVVSDCGAINDIWKHHKIVDTPEEACALAIKAGLNLNCGSAFRHLTSAVRKGLLTEAEIDAALKPLILTKLKLGFFDPPEENPWSRIDPSVVCSPEHVALAREEAAKAIVVAKNRNGVLPLPKDIRSLYVVGPQAASGDVLLGNYYGMSGSSVTILDGIVERVNLGSTVLYKPGQLPYHENPNPIDWCTGEAMTLGDAVVAVVGIDSRWEGEEGDAIASPTMGDRVDIGLPPMQLEFLRKLRAVNDKPLIVVVTGGSPMAIPEVMDFADAVLFVWYPGQEGGRAVADVLFGDVNPAGRLPFTVPYSVDDLPPFEDYSMRGRTYRYMEKEPLLPFGFGLSYTRFAYERIEISGAEIAADGTLEARVTVRNVGERDGDEVVQLYLEQPGAGETAPLRKLVGFERIHLRAGETATVRFELGEQALRQFTEEGEPVVRAGDYTLHAGGAVPIPRSVALGAPEPVTAHFRVR